MEELKMLVEMVAKLPNAALWVLAGYLVYKLAVIGSWFGLARFFIDKLHSWLTKPKYEMVEAKVLLNGHVISGTMPELLSQIERIKGRRSTSSVYVFDRDVDWLREAIDDKIAKDAAK